MGKKKTNEEFKQDVYNLVEDEYIFLESYINTDTKIKVLHAECNKTYFVTPNKFFSNRRCPHCKGKRLSTKNSWGQEKFIEEVESLYGSEYVVIGEYVNAHTEIKIKHAVCGETEAYKPYSFINGKRCSECFRDHKKKHKHFKKEVYDLVGDEYSILSEYELGSIKIVMKHNPCGLEYSVVPNAFLNDRRCPICSQAAGCKKRAKTAKEVEDFFNEKFNGEFSLIGKYENMRKHILIRHNTCGQEWEVVLNSYMYGDGGCPRCKESKGERKVRDWLDSNDISYLPQHRIKECRDIYPLPFDFAVLDDLSNILFLIEYDGEGHYQVINYSKNQNVNIEKFEARKRRDQIKNQYCLDNNIPLIRIPYWEYQEIEVILELVTYNFSIVI